MMEGKPPSWESGFRKQIENDLEKPSKEFVEKIRETFGEVVRAGLPEEEAVNIFRQYLSGLNEKTLDELSNTRIVD